MGLSGVVDKLERFGNGNRAYFLHTNVEFDIEGEKILKRRLSLGTYGSLSM